MLDWICLTGKHSYHSLTPHCISYKIKSRWNTAANLSYLQNFIQIPIHCSYCFQNRSSRFRFASSRCVCYANFRHSLPACLSCFLRFWSSPRPISNSQLHVLPHFHLCPIYLVVFKGSYFLLGRDISS